MLPPKQQQKKAVSANQMEKQRLKSELCRTMFQQKKRAEELANGMDIRNAAAALLQSQIRTDHHCLCKGCRRRSCDLGCRMCWIKTKISLTYFVLLSICCTQSSSCRQNTTARLCCKRISNLNLKSASVVLPSWRPGTAGSELRKWQISKSNGMQAGHAMLRLFLQRPSRNETLAHACTMKCAIHKTNICNKIKQFCTVYSMCNKPEQKCAKQKQKCAKYKNVFAQHKCAKLWTILCAKKNNTL